MTDETQPTRTRTRRERSEEASAAWQREHAEVLELRRQLRARERDIEQLKLRHKDDGQSDGEAQRQALEVAQVFADRYCLAPTESGLLVAMSAEDGLRRLVALACALHNAALARPEIIREGGETRVRMVSDVRTAMDCLRWAGELLGYSRSLSDPTRDAAKLTPEERVAEALRDPIHGPLLRSAVKAESNG